MNPAVLVNRRFVRPKESFPAYVPDHELGFALLGIPIWEPGFATIVDRVPARLGDNGSHATGITGDSTEICDTLQHDMLHGGQQPEQNPTESSAEANNDIRADQHTHGWPNSTRQPSSYIKGSSRHYHSSSTIDDRQSNKMHGSSQDPEDCTKVGTANVSSTSSTNTSLVTPCVHGVVHRLTKIDWSRVQATEGVGSPILGYQVCS